VYGNNISINHAHFLFPIQFNEETEVALKIRHTPNFTKAVISKSDNGYSIRSMEPLHGIAPGQFAVVYDTKYNFVLMSGEMES
jgi:tRNA-specific 2-thiouridylase